MKSEEIKELKKFFKNTPFVFMGGADKDNNPESIGINFKLQLNKEGEKEIYKEVYIAHTHVGYRSIHLSSRNAYIHTGMKAMERVSLLNKENYIKSLTAEDLIQVLPKTEEEFDKIINEYSTRMLGEVHYEEIYTFITGKTL